MPSIAQLILVVITFILIELTCLNLISNGTISPFLSKPKLPFEENEEFENFRFETKLAMNRVVESMVEHVSQYSSMSPEEKQQYMSSCSKSCLAISVRNGQLNLRNIHPGFQTRHYATLAHLLRVSKTHALHDVDFVVDIGDGLKSTNGLPLFVYSQFNSSEGRNMGVRVPDFTFFDWPETRCPGESSREFSFLLKEYQANWTFRSSKGFQSSIWEKKQNTLFWRGARLWNPERNGQVDRINAMTWQVDNDTPSLDIKFTGDQEECVPVLDHCKYRYLAHFQGNTYSSRLKYLLLCGSVVVMPKQQWSEWWYPAMTNKNMTLEVDGDLGNFKDKFSSVYTNLDHAARMAYLAKSTMLSLLSKENVDLFWSKVINTAADTWGRIDYDEQPDSMKSVEDYLRQAVDNPFKIHLHS